MPMYKLYPALLAMTTTQLQTKAFFFFFKSSRDIGTDLYYCNLDAVPPVPVIFLSHSRRWTYLQKWRKVTL